MRRTFIQSLAVIMLVIVAACSSHKTVVKSKPLPPGQEKKLTGSQSAKPYAPGQKKKKP